MKTFKKLILGVASLALATSATPALATESAAPPAAPESVGMTTNDYQEIRDFWTTYGVDEGTQTRLMSTIEAGLLTEATQGSAEPISTHEYETDSAFEAVSTFSDGSIRVSSMEKPNAAAAPAGGIGIQSITGCAYSGGSGYAVYRNCQVYERSDAVTTYFYATYQVYNGAGAQISSYTGLQYEIRGGYAQSNPVVSRFIQNASTVQPATLTYYMPVAFTNIWGNVVSVESIYLSLRVNYNGSAYSARY